MIIRELYIDGKLVDLDDSVKINRVYTSPFFSDVTKIMNNTTYPIKLPKTAVNAAIMEQIDREDSESNYPYVLHSADYYVNSREVFTGAEVKVTGPFEIQCVYGANRTQYAELFTKQLNEIKINGSNILENDWIVNWNRANMYVIDKKYRVADYVSLERKSTIDPSTGTPYVPIGDIKDMTLHPFIPYNNLFGLINAHIGNNIIDVNDFDLGNKGILLTGKETNTPSFENNFNFTLSDYPEFTANGIHTINLFKENYFQDENITWVNVGIDDKYLSFTGNTEIEGDRKVKVEINFTSNLLHSFKLYKKIGSTSTVIKTWFTVANEPSTLTFEIEKTFGTLFRLEILYYVATPLTSFNGNVKVSYIVNESIYSSNTALGYYDCLANMPKLKLIDVISEGAKVKGLSLGVKNGKLMPFSLDKFKINLTSGNIEDWTGLISSTQKSEYKFNSNAQSNLIKFANNDKLNYESKGNITVSDTTLAAERDLYKLAYDAPIDATGSVAEVVLYKQVVDKNGDNVITFKNNYTNKPIVFCEINYDKLGFKDIPTLKVVKASDLVTANYSIYQKLVNRPRVNEVIVKLPFDKAINIDFEKPIYVGDWGRYCLLLEIEVPDDELCTAKLLLINQTL